jgi:hypothetical protein
MKIFVVSSASVIDRSSRDELPFEAGVTAAFTSRVAAVAKMREMFEAEIESQGEPGVKHFDEKGGQAVVAWDEDDIGEAVREIRITELELG